LEEPPCSEEKETKPEQLKATPEKECKSVEENKVGHFKADSPSFVPQ